MNKHTHPLITICRYPYDSITGALAAVRWCPTCGAVVVDLDYDNRTNPGAIVPMKFPKG